MTTRIATVVAVCLLALTPMAGRQFSERRISVRGVQPELWDWLYVEAAKSRVPLGMLVNVLITDWQSHTDEQRRAALEKYLRTHRKLPPAQD